MREFEIVCLHSEEVEERKRELVIAGKRLCIDLERFVDLEDVKDCL